MGIPVMRASERACIEVAEHLLTPAGFTFSLRQGKHLRLVVVSPQGREGHLTLASSPRSDIKCQCNFMRQETTRLMRHLTA